MKKYKINTQPTVEPVTLAELKLWLKIDTGVTTEDDLLNSLITTARSLIEEYTGLSLLAQKWDMSADTIFRGGYLSHYPITAIDSVKLYDEDDTESTVTSTNYRLDSKANRIVFDEDYVFPTNLRDNAAMLITYSTGYGATAASVPEPLKQSVLYLAGILYEYRGACEDIPLMCKKMTAPYVDIAKLGADYG